MDSETPVIIHRSRRVRAARGESRSAAQTRALYEVVEALEREAGLWREREHPARDTVLRGEAELLGAPRLVETDGRLYAYASARVAFQRRAEGESAPTGSLATVTRWRWARRTNPATR